MVTVGSLGAAIIQWAATEPTISGMVLIGSQVHAEKPGAMAPDIHSDWDFQIITTRPSLFSQPAWLKAAGLGEPLAYAPRRGRLGSASKVSAVVRTGEVDVVVIPARRLSVVKWLMKLGFVGRLKQQHDLAGMAVVLRGGHRVVKGEGKWGDLLRRIATEISPLRLDDSAVRALAESFISDYVSMHRKIARGELIAAQRWLHVHLMETNFRLLHELRQRQGQTSQPDARRIESLVDAPTAAGLAVETKLDAESLVAAADKSAQTCRDLVRVLLGDSWRWPDLPLTPAR